jgi:hypothetical protein
VQSAGHQIVANKTADVLQLPVEKVTKGKPKRKWGRCKKWMIKSRIYS